MAHWVNDRAPTLQGLGGMTTKTDTKGQLLHGIWSSLMPLLSFLARQVLRVRRQKKAMRGHH